MSADELTRLRAEVAGLRAAVLAYQSEHENPCPDFALRKMRRDEMFRAASPPTAGEDGDEGGWTVSRHSMSSLSAAMLMMAAAGALGGGMPEVSRPARVEREPDDVADRIEVAKGKRAKKAAKRARMAARTAQQDGDGSITQPSVALGPTCPRGDA